MENVCIFLVIWNILQPFGTFYSHLEYITDIWYTFCPFGNLVVN
jgi:hypothetical protein